MILFFGGWYNTFFGGFLQFFVWFFIFIFSMILMVEVNHYYFLVVG